MDEKAPRVHGVRRIIYLVVGCIALALGTVGVVLPVLPTVPFFLLAAFCFAKSSERLHTWFLGTKLYQDNLADFTAGRGMTSATKARIIITVTLLMAVGFWLMARKALWVPCTILGAVWLAHLVYFLGFVKTAKPTADTSPDRSGSDC